jgi:hypothetical protein
LTIAVIVLPIGSTIMLLGPEPKEHFNLAFIQTHFGMDRFFYSGSIIFKYVYSFCCT